MPANGSLSRNWMPVRHRASTVPPYTSGKDAIALEIRCAGVGPGKLQAETTEGPSNSVMVAAPPATEANFIGTRFQQRVPVSLSNPIRTGINGARRHARPVRGAGAAVAGGGP